ncbi:MAG TPA: TIGR03118 family protein [Chthoniobacteraceae bacterium]|nr:TIGR03118 family protein [Chthoniobacteraceae bacterium]
MFLAAAMAAAPVFGVPEDPRDAGYVQTNLVANSGDYHPQMIDPEMINAWGIALRPPGAGGHIWISDAGSGYSSEFIGDVPGNPLHQDGVKLVKLLEPGFTDHGYAFVTGQAYNSASDLAAQPVEFPVAGPASNLKKTPAQRIKGGYSGSAKFVFVTEDGCINAWSANTAVAMDNAPLIINYSKTAKDRPYRVNCVFTGVALTNNPTNSSAFREAGGNHLFAADIRNNVIEVFDNQWKDVTGKFHFQTPAAARKLQPFNIVDLNGHLFVTYAKFDTGSDEGQEQIHGAGLGHVVEYNEDGTLIKDFHTKGVLNAPWGVAIAPARFGKCANDLLVGNFGDGTIAAFDLKTGDFVEYLRDPDTKIISIDGLWGLAFGNGFSLGDANALYFTAGPNSEYDGLFGKLTSREVLIPEGKKAESVSAK